MDDTVIDHYIETGIECINGFGIASEDAGVVTIFCQALRSEGNHSRVEIESGDVYYAERKQYFNSHSTPAANFEDTFLGQ